MKSHIQTIAAMALVFQLGSTAISRADLYVTYGGTKLGLFTDAGVFIRDFATDLSNPQGVAVDSAGNVFVSDFGNKRIRMYDKFGNFVRDVMNNSYSGGSTPFGLSLDSSGNLYASVVLGNAPTINQLIKWNPAGTNQVLAYGNYGPTYEGLFYDAPNDRLITTLQANFIQSFDGTTLGLSGSGGLSSNARGLTVGPGGDIYAGDLGGVVWKTNPDLSGATFAYAPFNGSFVDVKYINNNFYVTRPSALEWYDTSWNLLGSAAVTNPSYLAYSANTVQSVTASTHLYISHGTALSKYTISGSLVADLATDLSNARGVAVDPAGNVYVSDLGNGRIRMYDASGIFVRDVMDATYGGGTPQPFGLAWNATAGGLAATVSDVTTAGNTRMVNFDVSTTNTIIGAGYSLGGNYEGLAYAANGYLYATVSNVAQFFTANGPAYGGPLGVTGASALKGIAYKDATDEKFIVDFNLGRVSVLNADTTLITGLTTPLGITYSPVLDTLFVANWGLGEVLQYTTAGVQVGSAFSVPGAAYLATRTTYSAAATDNYSTWASGFTSPTLSDPASTADPDNDGLTNAMEYALGLDPRYSDGSPGVYSGGTLTFTKGAQAVANGDVTYEIETSTTLGVAPSPWTVVTPATDTPTEISFNLKSGPKNFARLKITLTSP